MWSQGFVMLLLGIFGYLVFVGTNWFFVCQLKCSCMTYMVLGYRVSGSYDFLICDAAVFLCSFGVFWQVITRRRSFVRGVHVRSLDAFTCKSCCCHAVCSLVSV